MKHDSSVPDFAKFNFTPLNDRVYNEKMCSRDQAQRLRMNVMGMCSLPEVISRNMDFFSALAIVGINPIGPSIIPVYAPHQRRFQALAGVAMRGPGGFIKGFKIPEIGANHLHKDACKNLMTATAEGVLGKGPNLLIRAREKKDGVEVIVFGVEYAEYTRYYMWDIANVWAIEATEPCRFERVDGKYYLLSDVSDDFEVGVLYEDNPWEFISSDLIDSSKEGIIVDIDTVQYKVPREPSVTLKVENGIAMDSGGKTIHAVATVDNGCYDFSVNTMLPIKPRLDRVYADSAQQVEIIRRCAISLKELVLFVPVPRLRRLYKPFKIKLGSMDNFAESLNINKAVVAPNLTPKVPIRMVHRKDYVRAWLRQKEDDDGCVVINYHLLEKFFYDDYNYIRDGMLINLKYCPMNPFELSCGFANYPKKNYEYVYLKTIDQRFAPYFAYRGRYLVFFDPLLWALNFRDDVDYEEKNKFKKKKE